LPPAKKGVKRKTGKSRKNWEKGKRPEKKGGKKKTPGAVAFSRRPTGGRLCRPEGDGSNRIGPKQQGKFEKTNKKGVHFVEKLLSTGRKNPHKQGQGTGVGSRTGGAGAWSLDRTQTVLEERHKIGVRTSKGFRKHLGCCQWKGGKHEKKDRKGVGGLSRPPSKGIKK